MKALLEMRRSAKEKELEAMLSGEHDSCSCFIEVTFLLFWLLFNGYLPICYPCKILPVSFEIEFSEWCAIAPPFVNILSFVITNMMILNCKAEEIEVCILVFNSSHKTHNTNLMLYQI